eukprot:12170248-Ditylum_brightwellii.AAC.1
MVLLYGSFGDLNVSIMTKHSAIFVHVHGCSGKAMSKQNKITKLATAYDACHNSAKNTKGK